MVLATWITPDLSNVQSDHKTEIPVLDGISFVSFPSEPGEFFLFSDSRFAQVLDSTNIYNGDYQDLQSEFDGYALFTSLRHVYEKD